MDKQDQDYKVLNIAIDFPVALEERVAWAARQFEQQPTEQNLIYTIGFLAALMPEQESERAVYKDAINDLVNIYNAANGHAKH